MAAPIINFREVMSLDRNFPFLSPTLQTILASGEASWSYILRREILRIVSCGARPLTGNESKWCRILAVKEVKFMYTT